MPYLGPVHRSDPDAFEIFSPTDTAEPLRPPQRSGPPMLPAPAATVIAALSPLVTEARLARIRAVVAARTLAVTAVLEDVADPHNGSAILRSADAFGLQSVHVIPGPNGFHAARSVAKGTHRWLDLYRHESAEGCVAHLHQQGFTVLVASMEGETPPEALGSIPKVAIVFGNEHRGPTPPMRDLADGTYAVPMCGFVESLNVSVAAGITLFSATRGRRDPLDEDAGATLEARYLLNCVRDADRVVRDYEAAVAG